MVTLQGAERIEGGEYRQLWIRGDGRDVCALTHLRPRARDVPCWARSRCCQAPTATAANQLKYCGAKRHRLCPLQWWGPKPGASPRGLKSRRGSGWLLRVASEENPSPPFPSSGGPSALACGPSLCPWPAALRPSDAPSCHSPHSAQSWAVSLLLGPMGSDWPQENLGSPG